MIDLSVPCAQSVFGELVGISQQAVSDLKKRGVIQEGECLGDWLLQYCSHFREQAAGRAALGDLDLATERAGLAKEQRLRIEMQNAVTRQEYGPIVEMEMGLSNAIAVLCKKLDSIPGEIKKQSDVLTADDLDVVSKIIAVARNEMADLKINWFGDLGDYDENEFMED